jgi:hypothetical protein
MQRGTPYESLASRTILCSATVVAAIGRAYGLTP